MACLVSQNLAPISPFLSHHQLTANGNYWKEHCSGFQWLVNIFQGRSWNGVFPTLSQFSRAEHFVHCRPFPPKPRGSSRHKGLLGSSKQPVESPASPKVRWTKGEQKAEQSAAPKSVSTWPRPWFNLAPLSGKNCPHRCCRPTECQRSHKVHLPVIKYIQKLESRLFWFLPISKMSSQPKLPKPHQPKATNLVVPNPNKW